MARVRYIKSVTKNLIAGLSESFEKSTKNWKLELFNIFNVSFLKLKSSIFAFAKKLAFAVRSWTVKFVVDELQFKVSIWRCQMILTFSGLHFLFSMAQILIRDLPNPYQTKSGQNSALWTVYDLFGKTEKKICSAF